MANIIHTKYASQLSDSLIEMEFGNILPQDLVKELRNLETASQFNSKEVIIKNSPYTGDAEEELARKKQNEKDTAQNNSFLGTTL